MRPRLVKFPPRPATSKKAASTDEMAATLRDLTFIYSTRPSMFVVLSTLIHNSAEDLKEMVVR